MNKLYFVKVYTSCTMELNIVLNYVAQAPGPPAGAISSVGVEALLPVPDGKS